MLFHLTEYCTLRCPHCMVNSNKKGKHADEKTVQQFIRFAHKMGTYKIAIAGGEPTEHPDFIKMFRMILIAFGGNAIVMLMTNGRFMLDKHYTNEIAVLQTKFGFVIQVSALKGIYPLREETVAAYHDQKSKFNAIEIVENITGIQKLGRARYWNYKHLGPLYQWKVPNCFNLYSAAKSNDSERPIRSFKDIINYMDADSIRKRNLFLNFCKPLIGWDGSIYVGESPECTKLGNIHSYRDPIKTLKRTNPCEECGIKVPDGLLGG